MKRKAKKITSLASSRRDEVGRELQKFNYTAESQEASSEEEETTL